MSVSNTESCFREFIGKMIVGVLFDTFPLGRKDLSIGSKTFVFSDGSAFTLNRNGSFGVESRDDVRDAIRELKKTLTDYQTTQKGMLALVED